MKVTFNIEAATSQLVLTPENARDKSCLELCMSGKNNIKIRPTTTDSIVIEFGLIPEIVKEYEKENE